MDAPMLPGYHFILLDPTGMARNEDTFTYSGECDMIVDEPTEGGMVHIALPRRARTVSWNLPRQEPIPPPSPTRAPPSVPGTGAASDVAGPSGVGAAPAVVGPHGAVAAMNVPGLAEPVHFCAMCGEDIANYEEDMWAGEDGYGYDYDEYEMPDSAGEESLQEDSDMHYSDLVEQVSGVVDIGEDAGDCIEVINVESSIEIIDLVSESEPEEDPSEATSTRCSRV